MYTLLDHNTTRFWMNHCRSRQTGANNIIKSGGCLMIARLSIAVWFFLHAATALASLPFATGESSSAECIDAMKLAKAMYQSPAQRLYAPLAIPQDMGSTLVLGTAEPDISGGNALTSTDDFDRLPQDSRIYWAKETNGALRVVVREIPVGWCGDMYSLYLLDDTVTQEDFLKSVDSASGNSLFQPIVSQTWRPPLVFLRNEGKSTWFIDVGQPFQILSDWRVYTSKKRDALCTIVFNEKGEEPAKLLPHPLRRLVGSLDEALGPGNDEGTLQPTARARLDTNHILANAALRPWALVGSEAYNSRSEVDAGLEDWAKVNHSRRDLYSAIQKEYPLAERSLATYYANVYGLQPQKAREAAVWVVDLIFRSFFVFASDGDNSSSENAKPNPWPLEH